MGIYIGFTIILLVLIFVGIILIRALNYKPPIEIEPVKEEYNVNRQKIVDDMVAMIQCKTISYRDEDLIDEGEFFRFRELIEEKFPLVHKHCKRDLIGKNGILY